MTNAIQLAPQTMEEAWNTASRLSKAQIAPEAFRGKPADAYMAICYGSELGLPPATSLASIAVIKGKPTLYAASMVALVLDSPKCVYFSCVEASATSATYETQRVGDPSVQRKTFTQADAKAAGISGGMYSKYPQRMLEARAKSALARDVYPDILHGLSSYEEVADLPDEDAVVAEFAEPEAPIDTPSDEFDREASGSLEPILERILECQSLGQLNDLLPELKEIPKGTELFEKATKLFKEIRTSLEARQ